jgi:aspartate/methionine/tyrosine aminotransferase
MPSRTPTQRTDFFGIPFLIVFPLILRTSGCTAAVNIVISAAADRYRQEFKIKSPKIILITPYDPESPQWVRMFECEIVIAESTIEEEWQLNVANILQKCDRETACILLVSPNAPSGVIYKREVLENLVEGLNDLEYKPILLVDCVFIEMESEDGWPTSIVRNYEKSVFCYSFAKDLGIGGSRVGCLCVPSEMHDWLDLFKSKNHSLGFLHPSRFELHILHNFASITRLLPFDQFCSKRKARFQIDRTLFTGLLRRPAWFECSLPRRGPRFALARIPTQWTLNEFQAFFSGGDLDLLCTRTSSRRGCKDAHRRRGPA